MTRMNYLDFVATVESHLKDIIRRCYPASWDENHITFTITDDFSTSFRNVTVDGFERPFKLVWDARKLRRPAEETLGDLAILVHLKSWEGESIEGVGTLEAKLRAPQKSSFDAVRKGQLKRIATRSPQSHLLLYDYSQITGFADNLEAPFIWEPFAWEPSYSRPRYPNTPYSHCATLPISMALSVGSYNTSLYKFCIPFSVQLCARYLRGYDLEMDIEALRDVKSNIQRHGGFRYLWLIGVSTGDTEPTLPSGINDDLYGPLAQ